ncbi:unnamed protein product [Durusdinium trenchii]|uniref:Uncharacterized protein n=1 Tax=Durusdinium trenchii TaxID=1381693 RepID=A0ABP0HBI2_9DINO
MTWPPAKPRWRVAVAALMLVLFSQALGACELLQEAFSDLVQRCGGSGPMTCALVLGGAGGTLLWIPGSPRIEVSGVELSGWKAPLAGAAFGLYSAQLPQGAALSDRYRQLCIWLADRFNLAAFPPEDGCAMRMAGAVYRLLLSGVSKSELEIQKELLTAAFGHDPPEDAGNFHPKATARIAGAAAARRQELGAVNASTALHLLAQARKPGEVCGIAPDLIITVVGGAAQPRDLAIASWAAARLSVDAFKADAGHAEALQALQEAVKASCGEMESQDVANVAWAFASMQVEASQGILWHLAEHSTSRISAFSPRHLAILTWALAKTKLRHETLMKSVAEAFESSQGAEWMPQDLSNFIWASAVLRCDSPLEQMASRAAALRWEKFRPQELSIAMWAAYSLGVAERKGSAQRAVKRMLQHGAREIRVRLAKDFEPLHLMNAAWALARWQRHCRLAGLPQECKDYVCRPALRILAAEAAKDFSRFGARELSRLMWAVASQSCLRLREMGPPLRDYVRSSQLQAFDPDDLVSLATSLSWMLERLVWELPARRTHSRVSQELRGADEETKYR